ncbi:hypothetical protein [Actinacidiphila reveromycinica]|uniref:hypothetical protein n=1 Tax=Actinacidiphila reveromycinica TaxID=659352 RepID=UPI001920A51B|nr:hypothetical protein [Streptomyces sp. SN-593]
MDPLARFLLGSGLGLIAAGVTYCVTTTPPWWWAVGLVVAILVWFGELMLDVLFD